MIWNSTAGDNLEIQGIPMSDNENNTETENKVLNSAEKN